MILTFWDKYVDSLGIAFAEARRYLASLDTRAVASCDLNIGACVDFEAVCSLAHASGISDEVIAAINASDAAFFSGGIWNAKRVMRISVCGWNTNADDVVRPVVAAKAALSQ